MAYAGPAQHSAFGSLIAGASPLTPTPPAKPTPTSAANPSAPPGPELPERVLDPQLVEAIVGRSADLQACMEEQDEAKGPLILRWTILPDGSVEEVRNLSEELELPFVPCIESVLKSIRFPPSRLGREVEAFPLKLREVSSAGAAEKRAGEVDATSSPAAGICCLQAEGQGFVVTSCGPLTNAVEERELQFPRLAYDGKGHWRRLEPSSWPTCPIRQQAPQRVPFQCPHELRIPELTLSHALQLRPEIAGEIDAADRSPIEQRAGLCLQHADSLWFGVSFYNSEGASGVGGVGRFDRASKLVEIRRPSLIRDSSTYVLAHDGRWLWMATLHSREGWSEPAHGLVRYDWQRDRLEAEKGGPCGGLVRGAAFVNRHLWVASDAGMSRRNPKGRWQHYLVRFDRSERPLEESTCEQLRALGSGYPYER